MAEPTHADQTTTPETIRPADNENNDDTTTTPTAQKDAPLPPSTAHQRHISEPDRDAQEMVISSLRSQIEDLISQVTQLNGKLVKSYDRVSDLEDDLHVASANLRTSSLKISELELERTQHLAALNTGLLVEKSHVTAELNRLMEKATEEAAQRGQAESARVAIEKELDDLSATLFNQANTMVAEARFERALSERKVEEAERSLKSAEEAVSIMQQQMQALQEEKEQAEQAAERMQVAMGKGKWVERYDAGGRNLTQQTRLLSTHAPYNEFLSFVAHLRTIHPASPQLPSITSLLQLPFLVRVMTEDSEPTLRLDLAPSLNWLSRRSVLSAIHTGQLIIEPIATTTLLNDGSYSNGITCALCGCSVYTPPDSGHSTSRLPGLPLTGKSPLPTASWSTSLFKKPASAPPTPILNQGSRLPTASSPQPPPQQIYIFRLSPATSTSTPILHHSNHASSSPSTSSTPQATPSLPNGILSSSTTPSQSSTIYPLCTTGWCLARLRATCTTWAYIRTGIIERIWEEEIPSVIMITPAATAPSSPALAHMPMAAAIAAIAHSPPASTSGYSSPSPATAEKSTAPPPVPPRKRGLWGMATALGEKAVNWGGDSEKRKAQSQTSSPALPSKALPDVVPIPATAPPPAPPSIPSLTTEVPSPSPSPALSETKLSGGTIAGAPSPTPPPLPVRSRQRTGTVSHGSGAPPLPPRANGILASSPLAGSGASPTPVPGSVAMSTSAKSSQTLASETIAEEEPAEDSPEESTTAVVIPESTSTTSVTATTTTETTTTTTTTTATTSVVETASTSPEPGANSTSEPEPAPAPASASAPVPIPTAPVPIRPFTPSTSPPSRPQSPRVPLSASHQRTPSSPPAIPPRVRPKSVQAPIPTHPSTVGNGALIHPARAGTPTSTPLPDSRPGTPTSPPPQPLRVSSPARQTHARQRSASPAGLPPPRSGSPASVPGSPGAPPPVPRRAAARARPVSSQLAAPPVTAGDTGASASAPASAVPAPAASSTSGSPKLPPPVEEKKEEEDSAAAKVSPPSNSLSPPPISVSATPSSTSDVEEFVDAQEVVSNGNAGGSTGVSGAGEDGAKVEEKEAVKEAESEKPDEVQSGESGKDEAKEGGESAVAVEGEEAAEKRGKVEEKIDIATALQEATTTATGKDNLETDAVVVSADDEKKGDDTQVVEKEKEEDQEENEKGYVGDATWEERTWKEVVRLKEEMFWARIGGVRV